jgi:hypothetical protein
MKAYSNAKAKLGIPSAASPSPTLLMRRVFRKGIIEDPRLILWSEARVTGAKSVRGGGIDREYKRWQDRNRNWHACRG